MSTTHCPSCHQSPLTEVIHLEGIPVFQNKVYTDPDRARAAVRGSVRLLACDGCGYVFNGDFDATLMAYDADYQNEQSHSGVFDQHLNAVVDLLFQRGLCAGRVVEIGCGKGAFLNRLWDRGVDALGFDTAYEGDDPRVRREYFSAHHRGLAIDTLILRHTLEHIADPLAFLRTLTAHCSPDTDLYIEVPDLDWIIDHQAFWDVFYEHVNYFLPRSLGALFRHGEGGRLFGD